MWCKTAFSAFLSVMAASALSAATFTVDVQTDTVDANTADNVCADTQGHCSLRAAVMQANATTGTDTIMLGAGIYKISITGTQEDAATKGDLDITEAVTIQGSGMSTTLIDAQQYDRIFHLLNIYSGTVAINDLTLQNGVIETGDNGGGAILNWSTAAMTLSVNRVLFKSNTVNGTANGDKGGALNNLGTAVLTDVVMQDNNAYRGGAIYTNSLLTLERSTLNHNIASLAGGGILSYGVTTVNNSTLSYNEASNNGGALRNDENMTLNYCTLAYNRSPTGANLAVAAPMNIENSIIAYYGGGGENCWDPNGGLVSLGHNIQDDASCALNMTGDMNSTDPMLDALADYGGQTPTHRLQAGSPAIDGAAAVLPITTDQRGIHRPWGKAPDIGAFERVGQNPAVLLYLLQ